ncbi:hypothetical protein [Tunturiibacter gelidoferens]|jgi:hypothetical protein|uniref:Uncharacterized protein n=1 Tax=Tunturiibacter gelidiferens TaxID=3069689 RepID=A0A9X0U2B6_9BACT|nr:hypothetical protein [Edaphobacter lichenicola]MBB5327143.1 hypothetical protein [Edaphobacter lichenicola]
MHRLFIALLLLPITASLAQSPAVPPTNSSVVLRSIPVGTECPIGFRANRQASPQILSAGDTEKNTPALGLHLTLDHQTAPAIESVEITVYGVSPKGQVLPTNQWAADTDTRDVISKSFQLQRSAGTETLNNADIWMHQVGALRWVDLNEVRYTDGTSWRPSGSTKCRAVPSNLILVGQK